jgi:dihydroflavonol-4-reductase
VVVLVTGAGGFLGAHVVARLCMEGRPVRALVRPERPRPFLEKMGAEVAVGDLGDEKSLRSACRGATAIVHCAGVRSTGARRATEQRLTNVEGTARLFRAAQDHGVERIVHVSTAAVLGADREGVPRDETSPCNLRALAIPYVESKLEAEERALSAAWGGMPVVVVNPAWLVGPRLDGRPPTIVVQVEAGLSWVAPGGISVADVEDATLGVVAALDRGRVGERYLLGGHNLPRREVYAAVARALGRPAKLRTIPAWWNAVMERATTLADVVRLARAPWTPDAFRTHGLWMYADSSKAARELGYRIRPFEETVERCRAAAKALSASAPTR